MPNVGEYALDGMAFYQFHRRAELVAYARGDRTVQPPATGILVDGKPTRPGQWCDAHLFIDRSHDGKRP